MALPTSLRFTYFNIRARGEATRLALYVGGLPFTDERITRDQFNVLKQTPALPFGQVPVLTVDGKVLSQSKAILRYCGRLTNLYPSDAWEAAKVDEIIDMTDDIMEPVSATFRLKEQEEKKRVRVKLLETKWPPMFAAAERLLRENETGYYVGKKMTIADLQAYVSFTWLSSGVIDHIPKTLFDAYPHISANIKRVDEHPKVTEWNAAHKK